MGDMFSVKAEALRGRPGGKHGFLKNKRMRHNNTAHVTLETRRCVGCGECAQACPKKVIGMTDLPMHRHAHMEQPDLCVGCLKCVKACRNEALTASN